MKSIEELRAALKWLEERSMPMVELLEIGCEQASMLGEALDELAAARPVVAAVARLMALHVDDCPCPLVALRAAVTGDE